MKYPFHMGTAGFYEHSKVRSPFRIGKTLSQPPDTWTLSNKTKDRLFAALNRWFIEWQRKHKVGLDPKSGEERWETRPHHFIRCARCKQKDGAVMHLVEPPGADMTGPFCTTCLDIVLARQFADEGGAQPDLTIYTVSTKAQDLEKYTAAILAAKPTVEEEPEIDPSNLF